MGKGNDGTCKAKLTFVRPEMTCKASCHLPVGHTGSHHGALKDKEGNEQMVAAWSETNERWVRK